MAATVSAAVASGMTTEDAEKAAEAAAASTLHDRNTAALIAHYDEAVTQAHKLLNVGGEGALPVSYHAVDAGNVVKQCKKLFYRHRKMDEPTKQRFMEYLSLLVGEWKIKAAALHLEDLRKACAARVDSRAGSGGSGGGAH